MMMMLSTLFFLMFLRRLFGEKSLILLLFRRRPQPLDDRFNEVLGIFVGLLAKQIVHRVRSAQRAMKNLNYKSRNNFKSTYSLAFKMRISSLTIDGVCVVVVVVVAGVVGFSRRRQKKVTSRLGSSASSSGKTTRSRFALGPGKCARILMASSDAAAFASNSVDVVNAVNVKNTTNKSVDVDIATD